MFSKVASRLHGETNPLYALRDEIAREGHSILDLTSGNVTEHGILFPQPLLEEILTEASRRSRIYRPDSFGGRPAREAVSRYYLAQDIVIPPAQILLTPGTSLSYWYSFKLLADEGDEILCPRPSYPLFDYIAALSGVALIPYRLDEERQWAINMQDLENNISTRTRALVVISPHNPTGHVTTRDELDALAELAVRHNLAVIADEVFNEFLMERRILPRPAAGRAPLVLTLNGFSKMFALPGIKFGWMGVTGEAERVRHALRALELISDTFLPVNEMVQAAAPDIMQQGRLFLTGYADEIRRRWDITRRFLDQARHCSYRAPDGGFFVTLRLERDEEAAAEAILRGIHTLIHPGYFYDIEPHHLVFSFAVEPELLRSIFPRLFPMLENQNF
ncbi:MAG: pyridoxal phosphate-dependent aminotransferase [Acidobacteriia bacterium]|nr:pyridoxal phosphate-dependent aminotransferase [Terriglobia bacterium]